MMKIFKYTLTREKRQAIEMQPGEILKVGSQRNNIVIWALVDTSALLETRMFELVCTGEPCIYSKEFYVGTVKLDKKRLVIHVFDLLKWTNSIEPSEECIAWARQLAIEPFPTNQS